MITSEKQSIWQAFSSVGVGACDGRAALSGALQNTGAAAPAASLHAPLAVVCALTRGGRVPRAVTACDDISIPAHAHHTTSYLKVGAAADDGLHARVADTSPQPAAPAPGSVVYGAAAEGEPEYVGFDPIGSRSAGTATAAPVYSVPYGR